MGMSEYLRYVNFPSLFDLLICTSMMCPFLIFLDYHRKANISTAIWYVIGFFAGMLLLVGLIHTFDVYLALVVPVGVFGYALAGRLLK